MYYEHKVNVKLSIRTIEDEVTPAQVEAAISDRDSWDYDIEDTSLITPVEVVERLRHRIRTCGFHGFKKADASQIEFAFELLDVIKADLEDFQEAYQEAL